MSGDSGSFEGEERSLLLEGGSFLVDEELGVPTTSSVFTESDRGLTGLERDRRGSSNTLSVWLADLSRYMEKGLGDELSERTRFCF